jgi:glycosyltransferase involved in cell wall biosynthesis
MTTQSVDDNRGTVLFVANTDWYLFNFRLNLIKSAQAAGWKPHLACPEGRYAKRLRDHSWPVSAVRLDARGINPLHELRAFLQLAHTMRRLKPDVIHLFTLKCVLYGCLAASLAPRARIVGAITGMGHLFTSDSWRTRLLKRPILLFMKLALRLSNAQLIFQNDTDRDEFVDQGLITATRTRVIRGSGVDCTQFQPGNHEQTDACPLRLLFCARLIAEKGIHEYLEATATLRQRGYTFDSTIAGAPYPGNPSSLNAAEIDRLSQDPAHSYLGHYDDMPGLLANTDIAVLPSYREGTPKSLLEAAACGCIIVASDIPGCAGIVEPGLNGYLVEPRQSAPLADALAIVLDASAAERAAMRTASRKIAIERFSDTLINGSTMAAYEAG